LRTHTLKEVSEDVAESFHVVSPRLLDAQVRVDGGVPGRARQVLVLPVWNVLVGAVVAEFLSQAEVDGVHQVALLAQPHEEVVGLDVAVDEVFAVDVLDATHLPSGGS
jgi:hypothetical protein